MNEPMAKILPAGLPASLPRLAKTGFANLRRDRFSGVYFAHAKVRGRLVRESLKTKSRIIAKQRLDGLLKEKRALWEGKSKPAVEHWTVKQVMTAFKAEIEASDRKPRAKQYRIETLELVHRTWPELARQKPAAVRTDDCLAWAEKLKRGNSASRFNGAVQTLRMVFGLALHLQLIGQNPVRVLRRRESGRGIRWAEILMKGKSLPSVAELARVFRRLKARADRRQALWFVRVLKNSGQRPESVRTLLPRHVDLANNVVHWPPVKHNKESNVQPMSGRLRAVMKVLLRDHPGGREPLLPILSPRKALAHACAEAGVTVLSPGVFRHWFTTRALEAGIPVPTVAMMRGDKDGGAMLLRTYAQARMEHLRAQAKKL